MKSLGYATGQFGKNHQGDRDEHLPTNHGFDVFFGPLYHLNASEEPENRDYPADYVLPNGKTFLETYGPRGVIRSSVSKNGTQTIEDTGPLTKKRMETIDEETLAAAKDFIRSKVKAGEPFFCWWNGTRMHFRTHVVKAPDKGELEKLIQLISRRVGRCLERQGLLEQDTESAWLDLDPAEDTDAMPLIQASSISYRIAVGPQQGRKAFMIRTIRHRPPHSRHPTSIAQFHWQGGLLPEDALPGWDDPGSVRTRGFHCAISIPGTEAEGQPHPLPRRACPKSPLAWAGHTSQARQRHPVHLQHRIPHTCRTSCGNDLGPAAQARFQYRHRSLRPVRRVSQSDCLY